MTDQNATLVARHIKGADTVLPVLTPAKKLFPKTHSIKGRSSDSERKPSLICTAELLVFTCYV